MSRDRHRPSDSSSSRPSSSRDSRRGSGSSELWADLPDNLEEKILDVTGPIQRKANQIRSLSPINWLPYVDAGLISEADYSFLTAYQQSKSKEERDRLLEYFKSYAFKTFVTVVKRICVVEEIQKFLVRVDDMLWEDINRADLFLEETHPWKAFLDLLNCSDEFVRNISSRIITKLVMRMSEKPNDSDTRFFLDWLKTELKQNNEYLLSVGRCLQKLLQVDDYRITFLRQNGIFRIIRLLCVGVRPQAQYQLVFCLWVSSFNEEVAEKMNKYSIIPVLIDRMERCPSEILKLPRVILATFRNLLVKPRVEGVKKHNALVMIQCKIVKWLEAIKVRMRIINDPEFIDDYQVIEDILKKYIAELSTFDEYMLEVKSGRLEWTVVHTSKAFWDENAARLNEQDYELLKTLISLLKDSKEGTVLCVAAHDLGEYMSRYPRGKKLVEEFGGKDALLKLLSHDQTTVKYHALKSLQILMLNNYDLLVRFVSKKKSKKAVEKWNSQRSRKNADDNEDDGQVNRM